MTELERLAADMAKAGPLVVRDVRGVVAKGALNVKNDWRRRAKRTARDTSRAYPYSITYDVAIGAHVVAAEVGPDKGKRQGPLGNLIEFGSVNNPPTLDGQKALDAEEPKFLAAMQALAERALW